jgi:putative tryptophan/tyrosine transport system substrate-binding protein
MTIPTTSSRRRLSPALAGLSLRVSLTPSGWKRGIIPHCMNDPQPEGQMASRIGRRKFLATLGGAAAAWPLAARAQPAMPVVGFVGSTSPGSLRDAVAAFHRGLRETGYVEGQNVAIEYRWAEGQYDRLPGLAADLVHRQVAVIAAIDGLPSIQAAKAATTTIPIVFFTGGDPVQLGLVASMRRPDGNLTGVTALNVEIGAKRLELLHELVPTASVIVLLVNPTNALTEANTRSVQTAAHALGLRLHVLTASTERDFDAVFARLIQLRAGGLVIAPDAFLISRSEQLATLALRHAVPAIFQYREFAAAGGLISYGGSRTDAYRQVGVYTGRVLKGAKPNELPVQQVTKVELFLNLKTAKALGITVPLPLSGRADEVIE